MKEPKIITWMVIKMKKTSTDLTNGNISLQLIKLMQPIFIGQLFQNLYNSVDSIVVGRCVGISALAAVSSSGDISHMLISFFAGLSVGAGIVVSRYYGAMDYDRLQESIHTTILFSIAFGLAMTIVGILLTPWLLQLVKCPADVYEEALVYLRVYFTGVLFTSVYNTASGILRAVGDSKNPLYYLMIASICNILLDLTFVKVIHMGVMGVALASVISQAVSVLLVFRQMVLTTDVYKLHLCGLWFSKDVLVEVLHSGIPAAIQNCLIAFSNLFVQRYVNCFGSAAMAGIGAAKKIDRFIGDIAKSLGMSTAVFASQNIGAKKYDRVFKGMHSAMIIGCNELFILGLIVYLNAESIVSAFTADSNAVTYGVAMMKTIIPLYFLFLAYHVFTNILRSFDYSICSMISQGFGMIVCRQVYLRIAMQLNSNIRNVYLSFPVGWGTSALVSYAMFCSLSVEGERTYSMRRKKDALAFLVYSL